MTRPNAAVFRAVLRTQCIKRTSMQSLPLRTTGQDFLHSCRHSGSIYQFCSSWRWCGVARLRKGSALSITATDPESQLRLMNVLLGLHLSLLTIAILVSLSDILDVFDAVEVSAGYFSGNQALRRTTDAREADVPVAGRL